MKVSIDYQQESNIIELRRKPRKDTNSRNQKGAETHGCQTAYLWA